jgi:AraC-like DNA-binding protein
MPAPSLFWFHPNFDGLGLFSAQFMGQRYALHTHDTYVIALITRGCEHVRIGKRSVVAPAGSVFVVNPEEWHDGEAAGCEGWSYRTFYPSVKLISRIARELGQDPEPVFPSALLRDPLIGQALALAHTRSLALEPLAAETAMLVALRRLVLGSADRVSKPELADSSAAHCRMLSYEQLIEANLAETIDLQQLARAGGVTRYQVIRDFRKAAGVTPTTFVRDRRLRRASAMLMRGASLVEAALEAGFADQSHLTRAFRAAHGLTPGTYRKAIIARAQDGPYRGEGKARA